jgi:two-component system cell cycle response regulator CtrA
LDRIGRHNYDAAFVEIMLPDIEGYEVIRAIRNGGSDVPVLIVSGLSRPEAKVEGLRAGADDFITKPFDANELRARVRAVLRRSMAPPQEPPLRVGRLQLNLDSWEAIVADRPVHFTQKEFAVLELLVRRRGCVVSKAAMLEHLYSGTDVPEPNILDVFVCRIRSKMAQAGFKGAIKTVWKEGYTMSEASHRPKKDRRHHQETTVALALGDRPTASTHRFRRCRLRGRF